MQICPRRHRTGVVAILSAIVWLCPHVAQSAQPVNFVKQIKPILEKRCVNCHHTGALFGELSLENRAHAFKKRAAGPVIVPAQPSKSPLFLVLSLPQSDRSKGMPPTGHRISDEDKELIRRWIDEGAKWPDGAKGVIKPSVVDKAKEES